jgi:hypothetical protein
MVTGHAGLVGRIVIVVPVGAGSVSVVTIWSRFLQSLTFRLIDSESIF